MVVSEISTKPGEKITLTAESTDPDGDKLTYKWWRYFEADTYQDDKRKKPTEMDSVFHLYEFTVTYDHRRDDFAVHYLPVHILIIISFCHDTNSLKNFIWHFKCRESNITHSISFQGFFSRTIYFLLTEKNFYDINFAVE